MSPADIDAIIRRAQNRTCRTRMRDGLCGQPATATIGGIPVCDDHAEAAAPVLDYIRKVMGS
jgi:hypothetical protein